MEFLGDKGSKNIYYNSNVGYQLYMYRSYDFLEPNHFTHQGFWKGTYFYIVSKDQIQKVNSLIQTLPIAFKIHDLPVCASLFIYFTFERSSFPHAEVNFELNVHSDNNYNQNLAGGLFSNKGGFSPLNSSFSWKTINIGDIILSKLCLTYSVTVYSTKEIHSVTTWAIIGLFVRCVFPAPPFRLLDCVAQSSWNQR